jgi:hypothetical protein
VRCRSPITSPDPSPRRADTCSGDAGGLGR